MGVGTGCGGGGGTATPDDGTGPSPTVQSITAPFAGPTVFALTGQHFAAAGDAEVRIRFLASDGTPFEGGTRDVVETRGVVASSTTVTGTSPPAFIDGDCTARVEVILGDGRTGRSKNAIASFVAPQLTDIEPYAFEGDDPTPFVLTGSGFEPDAPAPVLRLTALWGSPFAGGTSPMLDVPVDVTPPTGVTGLMPTGTHAQFLRMPTGGSPALEIPLAGDMISVIPSLILADGCEAHSDAETWPRLAAAVEVAPVRAAPAGPRLRHVVDLDALGEFEIPGYAWGVTSTALPTGGAGTGGKASAEDFSLHFPRALLPAIHQLAWHAAIPEVTITTEIELEGVYQDYLTWTLKDVLVIHTGSAVSASSSVDFFVKLVAGLVRLTAYEPGGPGVAEETEWNIETNALGSAGGRFAVREKDPELEVEFTDLGKGGVLAGVLTYVHESNAVVDDSSSTHGLVSSSGAIRLSAAGGAATPALFGAVVSTQPVGRIVVRQRGGGSPQDAALGRSEHTYGKCYVTSWRIEVGPAGPARDEIAVAPSSLRFSVAEMDGQGTVESDWDFVARQGGDGGMGDQDPDELEASSLYFSHLFELNEGTLPLT